MRAGFSILHAEVREHKPMTRSRQHGDATQEREKTVAVSLTQTTWHSGYANLNYYLFPLFCVSLPNWRGRPIKGKSTIIIPFCTLVKYLTQNESLMLMI